MSNDPNKSRSHIKLDDLLKMDGSDGFDIKEAEKELADLELRKQQIDEFKKKFTEIQSITNTDDYMNSVLKELVAKGMTMLDSIQREIEDNPRGRDVETAAAMMSSINNIINNINTIKMSNVKTELEKEKLALKRSGVEKINHTVNNNTLVVGTTNDALNILIKAGVVPDPNKPKTEIKEVELVKEEPKHLDGENK